MLRLFKIEFYKLFNSTYFWVLLAFFSIFLIVVPTAVYVFISNINKAQIASGGDVLIRQLQFFNPEYIWQNLTYIYKSASFLLAFITVISITSEYSYKTAKQNIIDGLSKKEFLLSKVYMIFVLSLFVTFIVALIGLTTTIIFSGTENFSLIFTNIHNLGLYFIYIFNFLLFSLFLGSLIRKSGAAIALMIFYVLMIEPILVGISTYGLKITWLSSFFPLNSINNLIKGQFIQEVAGPADDLLVSPVVVAIAYIILYIYLTYTLLKKRDM